MSSAATLNPAAAAGAIAGLLKWHEAQSTKQKLQLIPDEEFIYLILTLKKIPAKPRTNAYKIPLPHPLHSSSAEICLIIDDRSSSKPAPETVKQIIRAQNLPITKLIKLSKLKSNYKPFEAKRKLCDSYDLFLADKRVVHFLPKLLGGTFFKKKKIPVPIDMNKNWKGKVEKAGSFGLLYFRTGTCCVMKVGKVTMEREEIEENVREAVDRVVEFVPKKWGGVRSFHLKVADSVALPLYQALPDMKLKIEGVGKEVVEEEKGESFKGEGVDSERRKSGGKKKKEKGRIHEVNYMDVGLTEEEFGDEDSDGDDENEVEVSDDEGEEFAGKKRKKGVVEDEVNDNESEDVGVKKAKKGRGFKIEVATPMDVEKLAKKGKKVKKLEVVKPKKVVVESAIKENEKSPLVANKKKEKVEVVKPKKVAVESAIKENEKSPLVANKKKEKLEAKKVEKPKKPEDVRPKRVVKEVTTPKEKKSALVAKSKEGSTEKRSKKRVKA